MSEKTPTQQVSEWLAALGAALERGDAAGATSLFGDDSYWRDLVSFTWNLKTAEGPPRCARCSKAMIPREALSFATRGRGQRGRRRHRRLVPLRDRPGRGRGHVRLIGGKAWTLLTTMPELKGFEEKKGPTRDKGVEHGAHKDRKSWLEQRVRRRPNSASPSSPTW